MALNSRWTVLKYMLNTYGLGWFATNDATQADETTFSDESLFGGRSRNIPQVGADVRIRQNSTAADDGTSTYGEARVSKTGTFGAGTLTFDPGPGTTAVPEPPVVANNLTEALILKDPQMRWEDACTYMNAAITEFGWEKREVPLTLINDGDMLASGTTNWTTVGSGTLTKTAATFGFPHRYLSYTDTGTSEYLTLAVTSLPVEQGESYYYEVCAAKVSTGDGTVQLIDVTNSDATITLTNTSIDERVPILLINNATIPATCENATVRLLKTDTAGTQGLIVLWVILRHNKARTFTVQDRPAKVLWLGEMRATNSNDFRTRSWGSMTPIQARTRQVDAGIWRYDVDQSLSGLSVWYEEFVQPSVLTADSSTTAIEVEDLAAVTAERFLKPFSQDPRWTAQYDTALTAAVRAKQRRLAALRSTRQESQYVLSPLRV